MIQVIQATVAIRRIYMDISGEMDAALEALAKNAGKSKKAYVESLIAEKVAQENAPKKKGR